METTSPELQTALLQWVNTFNLPKAITSWDDLGDGEIFWAILCDIDPDYFHGNLPEIDRKPTENWIPRWQNLKHINRMVTTYIRDECDKLPVLSKTMNPDLKLIAIEGSQEQTIKVCDPFRSEDTYTKAIIKLLLAVLLAAMYSQTSNERMIKVMEKLGTRVGYTIATAIGEMESLDRKLAEYGIDQETASEPDQNQDSDHVLAMTQVGRDPELEREEKLIQAYTQIRALEASNEKLSTELESIRIKASKLEDELGEMTFQFDRKGPKSQENQTLERMKLESAKDKDYIAEIEANFAAAKETLENQSRKLERYKADAETKQALRDELQLVKTERDELVQKSKANENLKKKIQTLQDQERINQNLRQQLQDALEKLQELEILRERCNALQRANEESVETITNGEREIFDQKAARKRLEHEMLILSQKWEASRERQQRDHEIIIELEGKLQDLASAEVVGASGAGSLDDELAATQEREELQVLRASLHWYRLLTSKYRKATKPTTGDTANANAIILQQKIDVLQSRCTSLETRYLDVFQENLGLQDAMKEAEANNHTDDTSPFIHQRNQLNGALKELDSLQRKHADTTAQLADAQLQLAAAVTSNSQASHLRSQAEEEITALQKHMDMLQSELDDQKSLLRHALLSREAQQNEPSDTRSENEYKAIRAQLQAIRAASSEQSEDIARITASRLADTIEDGRKLVASSQKQIAERDQRIVALEAQLGEFRKGSLNKDNTDTQLETEAMRRELRLMSSAWYGLTNRLQSSNVTVQRRVDPPSSWIGRQRLVVGGTSSNRR